MHQSVFTEQEFKAGLARLGETDVRKILRGGALDGMEASWATEWLAAGAPAFQTNEAHEKAQPVGYASYALAS